MVPLVFKYKKRGGTFKAKPASHRTAIFRAPDYRFFAPPLTTRIIRLSGTLVGPLHLQGPPTDQRYLSRIVVGSSFSSIGTNPILV